MRKYFLNFYFFSLFISGILFVHCASKGGGDTPPTEILAPVSHLSISSPNSDGLVRVTAEAGFTDGGATVTITNNNAVSYHFFMNLFLREAFAHQTHVVTANNDGSFQESIEASRGDRISITYTKDARETQVNEDVPENKPQLPQATVSYQDLVYNPTTGGAILVANDGIDGYLFFYNINTQAITQATLAGRSGINRIDLDNTNQILVIVDSNDSNNILHYHIQSGNTLDDTTDGNQVVDVASSENFAVIGFETPTPAIGFYDLINDVVSATGNALDPNGNNQSTSHWVDMDNNGTTDVVALVSEASDGSFYLTTHTLDSSVPSFSQQTTTSLTGLSSPGGMVFFNRATEAFVTDRTNDRVFRFTQATSTLATINTEEDPRDVGVNSQNTEAYVVNAETRTLSAINLADSTVERVATLGLSPTRLATDPTGTTDIVLVLNTGDNTLSLYDP